jgi:hypothetical protein
MTTEKDGDAESDADPGNDGNNTGVENDGTIRRDKKD